MSCVVWTIQSMGEMYVVQNTMNNTTSSQLSTLFLFGRGAYTHTHTHTHTNTHLKYATKQEVHSGKTKAGQNNGFSVWVLSFSVTKHWGALRAWRRRLGASTGRDPEKGPNTPWVSLICVSGVCWVLHGPWCPLFAFPSVYGAGPHWAADRSLEDQSANSTFTHELPGLRLQSVPCLQVRISRDEWYGGWHHGKIIVWFVHIQNSSADTRFNRRVETFGPFSSILSSQRTGWNQSCFRQLIDVQT